MEHWSQLSPFLLLSHSVSGFSLCAKRQTYDGAPTVESSIGSPEPSPAAFKQTIQSKSIIPIVVIIELCQTMQTQILPALHRGRYDRKYNQCILQCNPTPGSSLPGSSYLRSTTKCMHNSRINKNDLELRTSSALRTRLME